MKVEKMWKENGKIQKEIVECPKELKKYFRKYDYVECGFSANFANVQVGYLHGEKVEIINPNPWRFWAYESYSRRKND